jgi:predicted transcriptional regulator
MAGEREALQTRVEPALRLRMEQLAKSNDRSVAAEIRAALRQHVERTAPVQEVR